MSALFAFSAIVLILAFFRERIEVKQTGWDRLARKYRCQARFTGKYRACWWAQFTVARSNFRTVVDLGRMTRLPIRLEFPPLWIGADSNGLYLKRNVWNPLHSSLLIPWDEIQSAKEVTYKDLVRNSPRAALEIAAGLGPSCKLLELRLSDPELAIVAQLGGFVDARRFLGGKLKVIGEQGL